jgi:glycosyltransferase involved in cell wall biosynthesis
MRIAVFHYRVTRNNPAGHCLYKMIAGLCAEHEFTVFAGELDNPDPARVNFVRVPILQRPMPLAFVMFYVMATWKYWIHRRRRSIPFDITLINECIVPFGNASYSHFCHRRYLDRHWKSSGARGLRGVNLWLAHTLNALSEPSSYRRFTHVVVPSEGLKRELTLQYPWVAGKVTSFPISVALDRMARPPAFDRPGFRRALGLDQENIVFVFIALGHFERKGLPLLFEALGRLDHRARLMVVGGNAGMLAQYRATAARLGIEDRVIFAGNQTDVRPYLWASDAFVLPSTYEVFPAVALEAAAALVPIITTRLNGVEEFLKDGENGWFVERDVDSLTAALGALCAQSADDRSAIAARARADVEAYTTEAFVAHWAQFFAGFRATESDCALPHAQRALEGTRS